MIEWEERLSSAGCRITAPRRAVAQVLLTTSAALSPREILEQGQRLHHSLGIATVYRTLALLEQVHLVRRIHWDGGCHGYVGTSPGHRHTLICRNCGRATEFEGCDALEELTKRVEDASGYRVDDHLLQLFGLCADCQQLEG